MKTLEKLINSTKENIKEGNHRREGNNFFYYATCICKIDEANKTFSTNNGGWGTQSTTRAINFYRKTFQKMGYKEMAI